MPGVVEQISGENWNLFRGDCCEVIRDLPDASIDFCIHSPPFSNLYIYSDNEADMGNCQDDAEFMGGKGEGGGQPADSGAGDNDRSRGRHRALSRSAQAPAGSRRAHSAGRASCGSRAGL